MTLLETFDKWLCTDYQKKGSEAEIQKNLPQIFVRAGEKAREYAARYEVKYLRMQDANDALRGVIKDMAKEEAQLLRRIAELEAMS